MNMQNKMQETQLDMAAKAAQHGQNMRQQAQASKETVKK